MANERALAETVATDPIAIVSARLEPWLSERAGGGAVDPVVRPSDHADAQINGALPLAKQLGCNPEISLPRSLSQVNLTISAPRLRSQDLGLSTSPLLIAPSITC